MKVERNGAGWTSSWHPFRRSAVVRRISGRLDGSPSRTRSAGPGASDCSPTRWPMFSSGISTSTAISGWGDTFEVLYEIVLPRRSLPFAGRDPRLSYDNAGRRLEAYRFGEDGGYYDSEGRPLKKMFLRSPMRYSRVTSGFSTRRFHPVLKTYRPHYGVDYGAPTGTPVRATANGVVSFAGWDRGGGRTVKIRHPNNFLTAYLHLSRFAQGIAPGRRVSQAEVIGFVGSTGLSTAPHLDYRIQQNGRWINPLALKSEPAEPIPEERLADFETWRQRLREGPLPGGCSGALSLGSGASHRFAPARRRLGRLAPRCPLIESRDLPRPLPGRGLQGPTTGSLRPAPGVGSTWRAVPWTYGRWGFSIPAR